MNVEKVKEGINKLKDMIKPEGVIDIKYTLEPIEKNEFYMSVKYIVPDDSPYLRIHSMSQNAIFRQDLNRELKTNIDAKNSYNNWLKKSEYKPVINIERKNAMSQLDANKMAPHRLTNGEWNHDTIGMIALDSFGNLSGSCTTSGAGFKMRGRVGDSPVIGAGLYVDNEVGAVVATGQGEDVIRVAGASAVVEQMRQGKTPTEACKIIVERINRIKKEKAKDIQICFIAVNKNGDFGSYSLHKGFNFAVHTNEGNKLYEAKSLD